MKKCLLSLMVIAMAIVLNCGNEPPEGFYEGTPEDSAAVHALLNANSELLIGEDIFVNTYIPVAFDPITFIVADSFLRNDSTIIKRHCDSTAMELTLRKDTLDFWFAKDTTCTVFLYDTFSVISLMHYDSRSIGYYDSAIVDTIINPGPPPDTTYDTTGWRIGTTIVDTIPNYTELDFTGNGYRHVYFDPVRDTVIDEETGDTLYPVREPHEFVLKRISYGTYYFPASSPDLPLMQKVVFTRTDGERDSIIASNYDTLYTGHIMNRFRAIDSLLTFTDGEKVTVAITLYVGTVTADMCHFYASCDGNRVQIESNLDTLVLSGPGIKNLCFEVVLQDPYYYEQPEKEFGAQMWLIPVEIQ